MNMRDRFFVRALHGTLPLLVWALHFFASYALVAAQCSPAVITREAPSVWMLALLSAAAAGCCGLLLWRAWLRVRAADGEPALHDWAALGSGIMGLMGVVWTSLPLLMLDGCA
ncbi:hypothetical protein ACFSQU_05835 [Massilia sp. GCM10020059]|uniref:Uncharacterized protein n=1 Tax=Massilia agrisoli TaxID=2892444 RepID=A0ABS8IX88_9BURK|nr:hypothetical protein [Massilia agrisoli]MCC6073235.1 hypothetical protein [Massilia agrisoli]